MSLIAFFLLQYSMRGENGEALHTYLAVPLFDFFFPPNSPPVHPYNRSRKPFERTCFTKRWSHVLRTLQPLSKEADKLSPQSSALSSAVSTQGLNHQAPMPAALRLDASWSPLQNSEVAYVRVTCGVCVRA
ncbi:hypothetical protein C0Q70_02568 [Pomacea canaliculata]|uniref:Uncharacterized protein n=1 Tax=Pomacea canaliculata TaxID=400727 RepID=A0A2T7PQB7_POMCA|nr:hypothetical protein C0Q70_02568 [Pomacea canaliculata]